MIHQADEERAGQWFADTALADVPRHADPERRLYKAFGLGRGGLRALASWKVLTRGLKAGFGDGHGVGRVEGDARQMPGVFVVHGDRVLADFVHETAADRPDYVALTQAAIRGSAA